MSSQKNLKDKKLIIIIVILSVLLASAVGWGVYEKGQNRQTRQGQTGQTAADERQGVPTEEVLEQHGISPLTAENASNSDATAKELAFMIEEEKLAHDIYQALYDKWGARTFSNIKASETTHQNMLLAVMQSRNLPDPRQAEIGKFTNQNLQNLYDSLVERGLKSQTEAFEVGVLVEETDIADLKTALTKIDPKDTDVKYAFEALLNGSENHLRAFNRRLGR